MSKLIEDKAALRRVNLTFADFNDPHNVRFYNTALNVAWQKETEQTQIRQPIPILRKNKKTQTLVIVLAIVAIGVGVLQVIVDLLGLCIGS